MRELRHVALAITGASGAVYGLRLLEELRSAGIHTSLVISNAGGLVLHQELGLEWTGTAAEVTKKIRDYFGEKGAASSAPTFYAEDDFLAPMASGSAAPDAMVVCPCSMGTLGRIAAGLSGNLIERAADVAIKEGRPLLLVPRETPLSPIHLENLLKLARLGVRIIPPMPGFYGAPRTLDDLVDFVVGKVLDQLGVEHTLYRRWGAQTVSCEQWLTKEQSRG